MSKSQSSMLVKNLNALVVTHSILVEDVDMDVGAEVTVIIKPLPIHPIQVIKIKELRIKDIATLQDLKATIKDNLLEPVLKPKDALGNKTIKPIDLQTTDLQGIFKTETLKTIIMLNRITIKTEVKPKAQFLLERITTIRKGNASFRLELAPKWAKAECLLLKFSVINILYKANSYNLVNNKKCILLLKTRILQMTCILQWKIKAIIHTMMPLNITITTMKLIDLHSKTILVHSLTIEKIISETKQHAFRQNQPVCLA
ncbi:unnamed protein product [Cylindrotheca closterium]|uniref:Uncharacterized protein n=1 Tax=Cylindrotheca closterium TaxID=2856 RepID=A0AAD2G1X3_9STRA|nr:unnamed protein product [Cylindrotheca closterium]